MRIILLAFIAIQANAGILTFGGDNTNSLTSSINGQAITPGSVTSNLINGATVQLIQNGATQIYYPNAPLVMSGNINSYLQSVIQNFSNGTLGQSAYVLTGDLGTDTSYYFNIQQSGSKFSNPGYAVFPSSSSIWYSSDGPVYGWADTNGALNNGSGHIILGSSNAVTGNIAMDISSGAVIIQAQGGLQMIANSTISAGGGAIGISTAASGALTTANNLQFNTAGQAVFTPNISSFSVSGSLSGTYTNTTLGLCIANSTVTLTLPSGNSKIMVLYSGTASVASLAGVLGSGIVVDGGFVNGETASKAIVAPLEAVSTDGTNVSFSTLLTGLSSGTHSVCYSPFVSTGTGTIDSTNSIARLTIYALP